MVKDAVWEIVGVEDGADEDEEPRKITIMRTEIAYRRLVYRVSTFKLSHIQHCHMVAADRLCKVEPVQFQLISHDVTLL